MCVTHAKEVNGELLTFLGSALAGRRHRLMPRRPGLAHR